jgi:uncharacterized repeat protein (TIGR02543 family)
MSKLFPYKMLASILALAIVVSLTPLTGFAQTNDTVTCTISGVVKDAVTRQLLAGVTVKITKPAKIVVAPAMTDINGNYTLRFSLKYADYMGSEATVEASKSGYQTISKTKSPPTGLLHFELTPKPAYYTLTVNKIGPAGSGTVTPASGTSYASGTTVTLTASPASGYNFTGWSQDASGTTSTTTITMNSNKTVTANFSPAAYLLNVKAVNGRVIQSPPPDKGKQAYTPGTVVTLRVGQADPGYVFVCWSGDASGTASSVKLLMNSNKTVTANFARVGR